MLSYSGNTPVRQCYMDQPGITKLGESRLIMERSSGSYHPSPNIALHDDKWMDIIESDYKRLKDCVKFGGIPEEKELDYHIVDDWDKVKAMLQGLQGLSC
jgi:hypothetical protein